MFSLGVGSMAFIIFILETTFLRHIEIDGIKPDLILVVVIYSGLFFSRSQAITTGFVLGLIQDSLSFGFLGLNGLLKGCTALIIATMKERYLSENLLVEYVLAFIATVLNGFAIIFLTHDISEGFTDPLSNKVLFMGLYNALFVPPVFFIINKIRSRFKKYGRRSAKR